MSRAGLPPQAATLWGIGGGAGRPQDRRGEPPGALALYGDEITRGCELAATRPTPRAVLGKKVAVVRGSATTAQEGIAAVGSAGRPRPADVLIGTYVTAISNAASESALNNNKLYWETNSLVSRPDRARLPKSRPHRPQQRRFRQALGGRHYRRGGQGARKRRPA
jgi:hypothetical protein